MRNAYRILAAKPEGMKCLEILGRVWKDNIEVDIKALACGLGSYDEDMDQWQAHINEPSGCIKGEDRTYVMMENKCCTIYLVIWLVDWEVSW